MAIWLCYVPCLQPLLIRERVIGHMFDEHIGIIRTEPEIREDALDQAPIHY